MTVAELLQYLAHEVVRGRGEWEIDVSILKANPSRDKLLRDFGVGQGVARNTEHKKVYVLSIAREPVKGEL